MYIRHLPCKHSILIDDKTFPIKKVCLYNPSASSNLIYVRATEKTNTEEINSIILINDKTSQMHYIKSPDALLKRSVNMYQGIEDLRIVTFEGRIWFTGTTTHATCKMINELVVGYFDSSLTKVEKMHVVDIGSLPVKNVCPFVWKNKLCLLDILKNHVYEINMDDETDSIVATKVYNIKYTKQRNEGKLRGSTSPVHLHGNTWGFVAHNMIANDGVIIKMGLSYLHYWVEMDMERGMITYVSKPFWCAHWGVEYISGIRYNSSSKHVELFLGVNDSTPVHVLTTLEDLRVGK